MFYLTTIQNRAGSAEETKYGSNQLIKEKEGGFNSSWEINNNNNKQFTPNQFFSTYGTKNL